MAKASEDRLGCNQMRSMRSSDRHSCVGAYTYNVSFFMAFRAASLQEYGISMAHRSTGCGSVDSATAEWIHLPQPQAAL